ncbi:MAG: D-alanyl-D-alanine carboxypeptidase family protein [Acutalibacteraceae bacterium]|nr:D-alanyl-D-alanine carboxypeptidase [Oscillospiraceae bacterium]
MRKKTVLFFILLLLLTAGLGIKTRAISASSAVVMKSDTNKVLYELNPDAKLSMASTTKIMTAVLAVESGRMEQLVEVTEKMTAVEGTSMGLRKGDILTLGNIVKGMMLLSGNDAANAVATFLSGSSEKFAEKMNEKAKQLGMKNTNFVTPSGLDDEEHYTTAYDMALLGSYAMKNPVFRQIVSEYYGKVSYVYPKGEYTYRNHNRFLTMYEGACGIKTGFTKKSGRCLVTAVEKDGAFLVAVTLNSPDDWNDHIALYDECIPKLKKLSLENKFDTFIKVAGGDKTGIIAKIQSVPEIAAADGEQLSSKTLIDKFIYAPVSTGERVGEVRFYLDGICVAARELTASESVERIIGQKSGFDRFKDKIFNIFRRRKWQTTA